MKSPLYILSMLLPLATEVAIGSPVAEPDFVAIEERGRGNNKGWDKEWDDHREWDHKKNPCEVQRSYPYYKYPCDSSPSTGMSQVGAIFTPSCKYQWVHSASLKFPKLINVQIRQIWSLVPSP